MPDTVLVKSLSTFQYPIHPYFKYCFLKDEEIELPPKLAEELISKNRVVLIEFTHTPVVNKSEGPSRNADSNIGPGNRTGKPNRP